MRKESDEGVELEVEEVKAVTEKAILVIIEGSEYWLPKSQIHENSEMTEDVEKGDSGDITVTTWWAEKENLA